MARPTFQPTPEQRMTVSIMAACAVPQRLICERIINPQTGKPLDKKTLERAFRAELDEGMATANGQVAQALFKKAIGGGQQSVTAAIFWLKCKAGWKPIEGVEVTGAGGQPIKSEGAVDEKAVAAIVKKLKDEFIDT